MAKMTEAYLKWRAAELQRRWREHEYHNTSDNDKKHRDALRESDLDLPRVS